MVFCKVLKNKSYFKRYQVKYRRRREGKTDYYARRKLIKQDQDKYDSKKYRFIVRITNNNVIAQVAYPTIEGDIIICRADSKELPKYGIKHGLTNYAACYCTGLLVARRLLKNLNIDSTFTGKEEIDGELFNQEDGCNDRRPFKCVLDIGIRTATTGNRVFGVLKGACDGGLNIPHSNKRFPGYSKEGKEESYDAQKHRERIFGLHVANYMNELKNSNNDDYNRQFSQYIKDGVGPEQIEGLYKNAHEQIRKNPQKAPKKIISKRNRKKDVIQIGNREIPRQKKLTKAQRQERVNAKMLEYAKRRAEN